MSIQLYSTDVKKYWLYYQALCKLIILKLKIFGNCSSSVFSLYFYLELVWFIINLIKSK